MYSISSHLPIVNKFQQNEASCKHHGHCTIIPPHMQKIIKNSIADPLAKEKYKELIDSQKRLRARRAKLFSGEKTIHGITASDGIIKIFDAKNKTTLPGQLVEAPMHSQDITVSEAYNWSERTHGFYKEKFNRNSIDNKGMQMASTVHFGEQYNNAFWDGRQMVYGDGDGKIFDRFTIDPDIATHEFTHGVIQYDNNLVYRGQSGALNESISDAFASMAKQYISNESIDEADWLIGQQLVIGENYALRSMKMPGTAYVDHPILGTDSQPATMDDYNFTSSDNYGVHINSGIPNHAFYIYANKLYELDKEKYKFSWDGAGKVWYLAKNNISSNPTFLDFAYATIGAAEELYGADSAESNAAKYSWKEVKVTGSTQPPAPTPPRCNLT